VELPANVTRGVRALRRLLREQTFDLRGLDLPGFRDWLGRRLEHWRQDPVFVQRGRLRDLRREHPLLGTLEKKYRRAAHADAASAPFARLRRLEQEIIDTDKAVAGLGAALERAVPESIPALREKLTAFQARVRELHEEQARLVRSCPERQNLLRVRAELDQLRRATGLDREDARLESLLKRQGRRSGQAGESFEQLARTLTERLIVPELRRVRPLHVLTGVTLGAARIELDQLVIRKPKTDGRPVEVLAVVEVKRNLNDLAHGFRLRQENLAWLSGAAGGYDPALYRTRDFPSGHFDRAAVHRQGGEAFLFSHQSFRRFRREPATETMPDHLYFISRAGTIWGVSAAALGRIGFRVATDERWEPEGDAYLRKLLRWCQSLAEPTETPDVLEMYAATPARGRQVLVVGR
jgi:hypothetical protein